MTPEEFIRECDHWRQVTTVEALEAVKMAREESKRDLKLSKEANLFLLEELKFLEDRLEDSNNIIKDCNEVIKDLLSR